MKKLIKKIYHHTFNKIKMYGKRKKIIRKIYHHTFNIIVNILYKTIFLFSSVKSNNTDNYFSICAIFKNEALYLKEWIEFHKLIGVDHIYLYNNFSTDHYAQILEEYISAKYVTLIDWPIEMGQISAYENCYFKYRNNTKWLMFLDLDEFICLKHDTNIKHWLSRYEKYPSVILYWLMFGTNGIVEFDSKRLVIEQFTHSWKGVRNLGKIILNTDFEPIKVYHHHILCRYQFLGINFKIPMINENKKFISFPGSEACPKNGTIQINHYWSKSLQEYIRKVDKGSVFSQENDEIRKKLDYFYWRENRTVSENKIIWRFLIQLKVQLNSMDFKLPPYI